MATKRASQTPVALQTSVKAQKESIISGIPLTHLDELFIEQQSLYNQYVPLNIDCHGPLLRIKDYYDCFKVFQGPTVKTSKTSKTSKTYKTSNSLNITGHFQFHSGLIVKKMPHESVTRANTVNGIHVTLDDYVDLLGPFRRSSNLKITDMGDGWKIGDDQSPPPPRSSLFSQPSSELLRTDGLVKIVKDGQQMTVQFSQLLNDNIHVFESFQNKVNIVTGHNLSPALIHEYSLLFIHNLLTKQYNSNRNARLVEIVKELNKTHSDLVEYTKNQILEDIRSFGLIPSDYYIPQNLKETEPTDRIPEHLFATLVAQISSTSIFRLMGNRYLLGGYSCVGTTAEDKYKCDDDQDIIPTPRYSIPVMESLAFTLTFRVDMVYDNIKYFFSFILDRDDLNRKLETLPTKKGVFKQYELYKDILDDDSFKTCIMDTLSRFATATVTMATETMATETMATETMVAVTTAIEDLWPERTIDLIQNGCASIDHCMTLLDGESLKLDKLDLQFHAKEELDPGVIILRPNPLDPRTNLGNISQERIQMDPVVNVHLHFSNIINPIKDYLSLPPGGNEIVGWEKTVNDYDADIIGELLDESHGDDWHTESLLRSEQSFSVSIQSRDLLLDDDTATHTHEHGRSMSPPPRGSPDPVGQRPPTESAVRGLGTESITSQISTFLESHKNNGYSTQNPTDDCAAQEGSPPPVGFFTQYRIALVEFVKNLFKRPPGDAHFGTGGGGSLHKNPRRSKTRTRRNKKYSRKKGRRHSKYVKTHIKRRRATYKK